MRGRRKIRNRDAIATARQDCAAEPYFPVCNSGMAHAFSLIIDSVKVTGESLAGRRPAGFDPAKVSGESVENRVMSFAS
jgi:hypothetical protein